jgi:hypothetical protein
MRWPIVGLLVAAFACSGSRRATTFVDASTRDAGPTLMRTIDAGRADAGGANDPCSAASMMQPKVATTYYMAIDEPGADNAACDGLAPSDQGAGHCPFKDLSTPAMRALLDNKKSTRLELRAGTYVLTGWDGLRVTGIGQSEDERVVLSAYPGEHPVLDVAAPDGAPCTASSAPTTPACVREVVRISGSYTLVQGLTLQNGLAYHAEITGGMHHVFRCNTLRETVAFAMRSDQLKLDGSATDVQVLHNDFSKFRSQAIDMAQVFDVLVEDNEFHDPIDDNAGATGTKFGSRNVTIRGNRVHDLGASGATLAFSLGGTGSPHPDDHAAYQVHVEANRIWNVAGKLAQLVSCVECSFERNDAWDVGAGVLLSAAATGDAQCTATSAGCGANSGSRIAGNRMRGLNGGGDAAQANVFVYVERGEQTGFDAGENLYCVPSGAAARFGWLGDLVDFDAWRSATASDASSLALAADDPRCTGW